MTRAVVTIEQLRACVTEKGPWFVVPAEARPTTCRSCGTTVYFVTTAAGKHMPVDVLVEGGVVPLAADAVMAFVGSDGRGVSHFATCPQSAMWRHR